METYGMAGHMIRRLHQKSVHVFLKRIQEAGFDLTPVQFAAMEALRNHPKIDQSKISRLIAYDRATIGGVIDRLEQKGYVTRIVSKQDRRAREVSLSAKGRKAMKTLLPIVTRLQRDILSTLDKNEQDQFLLLLQKAALSE